MDIRVIIDIMDIIDIMVIVVITFYTHPLTVTLSLILIYIDLPGFSLYLMKKLRISH